MKPKKPLEWTLSKIPEKDMPWASSYLRNKLNEQQQRTGQNHPFTNVSTPKEFLVQAIELCTADDFRDPGWLANTDKQMKQAWLQRKRRTGASGDKPYSFFMNKQVQTCLHQLAAMNGTSINKTLEQLILNTSGVAIGLQEKHRIEVGLLKQRHQEELDRLKESAARKRTKQPRDADLGSSQLNDPQQAQSPPTGTMLPTEELEKLVSNIVDQRLSEIAYGRTSSPDTSSADYPAGDGQHSPEQAPATPTREDNQDNDSTGTLPATRAGTEIMARSSYARPESPFGLKLEQALKEEDNHPDP